MASKKKITIYFPEELVAETKQEAERQDRSLSWIMQRAWIMAREDIRNLPGVDFYIDADAS